MTVPGTHEIWAEIEALLRDAIRSFSGSLDDDKLSFLNELIENREYGLASEILVEQMDDAHNAAPKLALASVARARHLMETRP